MTVKRSNQAKLEVDVIRNSTKLSNHQTILSYSKTFCSFSLQTILIQNIYRNPQNSAQTADASRCKLYICQQPTSWKWWSHKKTDVRYCFFPVSWTSCWDTIIFHIQNCKYSVIPRCGTNKGFLLLFIGSPYTNKNHKFFPSGASFTEWQC